MADVQQLVRKAQVQGRIPSPERALRWLRATASILADWGGETAKSALPRELLRGAGAGGGSWESALAQAGGDETVALQSEAGRRAAEPDPGKVSWSLKACLGLVRDLLDESAAERVASALPGGLGQVLREARWDPPWRYRLVPQPFGAGRRRQQELRTGSAIAPKG